MVRESGTKANHERRGPLAAVGIRTRSPRENHPGLAPLARRITSVSSKLLYATQRRIFVTYELPRELHSLGNWV